MHAAAARLQAHGNPRSGRVEAPEALARSARHQGRPDGQGPSSRCGRSILHPEQRLQGLTEGQPLTHTQLPSDRLTLTWPHAAPGPEKLDEAEERRRSIEDELRDPKNFVEWECSAGAAGGPATCCRPPPPPSPEAPGVSGPTTPNPRPLLQVPAAPPAPHPVLWRLCGQLPHRRGAVRSQADPGGPAAGALTCLCRSAAAWHRVVSTSCWSGCASWPAAGAVRCRWGGGGGGTGWLRARAQRQACPG
jgi:hypothetical protein